MTIDERIKYAEQKRDEAFSNGSLQSLCYWDGYIAALKAVSDESGYRKASEVAREIFAEIEKFNRPPLPECAPVYIIKANEYAELKKKYTEGEG